ncbi:hypothetical protein [Spirochaeta cellobiosiphila]|uniref:hypothetical protein n=1 Tax=Spirochaeta cellobiosiphila TaxID=504483 RepID=UPI000429C992|nr:hypothetical protein [Spirochaeta cellobiosiphila]
MKTIFLIITITLTINLIYSEDVNYIITKNCVVRDGSVEKYQVNKGNKVIYSHGNYFYNDDNDYFGIYVSLVNKESKNEKKLFVDSNYIEIQTLNNVIPL